MDHKLAQPVKSSYSKKAKISITLLILVILGFGGYAVYSYYQMTQKIEQINAEADEKGITNVTVKHGELTKMIDDITGTVRAKQSVYLFWQISGTVESVNVAVGDEVSKGQVLASLDSSTIDASVVQAMVTKEDADEKYERLFLSSTEFAQTLANVAAAQSAMDQAQDAYDALVKVRKENVEIGIAYDDMHSAQQRYDDALTHYNELKERPLDDTDRMRAVSMMENAKSTLDRRAALYGWYTGNANPVEVDVALATIDLAKAQYDDALRAYQKVQNGPTQNQIRSVSAQIDAASAVSKTAHIISPIDGIVAQVEAKAFDVITYDGTVQAGTVLALRVDDVSDYFIDIAVSELDINQITLGQEVKVTFDAIPLKTYTGVISNISNSGTISSDGVDFDLTVKMDHADGKIKSGMTTDVNIVIESVKDALYIPRSALSITENGERTVKRKEADGTITDIPVELGFTSGSNIQILSDQILVGDELITVRANQNMSGIMGSFQSNPNAQSLTSGVRQLSGRTR